MASALRNSTPSVAPLPVADHDRHRRREAERARAGDDEHGDGVDERVGEARLGPDDRPDRERERRRRRRRPARRRRAATSASALDRRAAALRLAHHARRCARARVSAPTRSARMTSAPVPLTVAPTRRSPGAFSTGIGLAREHRLVDGARALEDDAVDRDLLARPDAQPVADGDGGRGRRLRLVAVARGARRAPAWARGRAARAARAPVRARARSSSTWPSSTSVTMAAAASK